MKLSTSLVFVLNVLCAQGRAQGGTGAFGTGASGFDSSSPIGNCICTPFYNCHDAETSSVLNDLVDDRSANLPVNQIVTVRQEGPNDCPDVLDVCCFNLVPPSVNPTSNQPEQPVTPRPSQPQRPIKEEVVDPAALLDNIPTSCTGDRPQVSPDASCGVRNPCGIDFAVSGFTDRQAQYGEFPWMVAVLTTNTGFGADMGAKNLYVGGGSLINRQVVLTAAHKAEKYQNKKLTVRLGEWNFASTTETIPHQDIPVKDVIIHDRYNFDRRIYNIALLVLERPVDLGETVGTICLASNSSANFDGYQNCIVSGWGKDVFNETGRYQRILKSLSVNIVERNQCQSELQTTRLGSNFEIHRGMICAGNQGRDACTGDGGSPLVCPHPIFPGQYVQVGVVAWGIGCGEQGIPGVYWAITPMMGWIQTQLDNLTNRGDI